MRYAIIALALALSGCYHMTPAQECAFNYTWDRQEANDSAASGELFTGQDEYNAAQVTYGNCMAAANAQASVVAQKPSQMPTWP